MQKTFLLLASLALVSLTSAYADDCRDPRNCGDRRIVTRDDVRRDRQPEPPRRPDYNPEPPRRPDYRPEPPRRPDYNPEPPRRPDYRPEPPRRPDYNPEPPRRPDYNPEPPRRPDYRPEPPRRPDYNPEPPRRPDYRPEPPRRPDYNPEPPRRPDYSDYRPLPPSRPLPPQARRCEEDYGRFGHRPDWRYNDHADHYRPYHHEPVRYSSEPVRRFPAPVYYQRTLPWKFIYWNTWLRVRVDIGNGFSWLDNYPYFVFNGYSHRYSSAENCNYELVDGRGNSVYRDFSNYSCNTGYDMCASLRDDLNSREYSDRFFCSERVETDMYSQNNWNYQDDFYSDVNRY